MHSTTHSFFNPPISAVVFVVVGCVLISCTHAEPGNQKIDEQNLDPEPIRVTVDDLPEPYATPSAHQSPQVADVPEKPTLNVPDGFEVQVFADNVPSARWLAVTPNGDVLCASSRTNTIYLLRDNDDDGVADETHEFLDQQRGANLPFGMAFLDGSFYLGNTDAVLRYDYKPGQTELAGEYEKITDLPGRGYHQHWTRNVVASPDEKKLYVTVGSKSNVSIEPEPRATVLRMNPDGSAREVFASGLRNPVGLDFHPVTNEVYVTVNERDGLGDNLVPDYFTRVQKDEFYGWPYAYFTPEHLDPRHTKNGESVRPDLVQKTSTPDVLFESHSAALGLTFYEGEAFPKRYRNGAFVAFRGSWNRSRGTGYKIVYVPFDKNNRPKGYYEDFVTGFLIDPAVPRTWGRPVGVTDLPDGSLLFTTEINGMIYRVQHKRHKTQNKNEQEPGQAMNDTTPAQPPEIPQSRDGQDRIGEKFPDLNFDRWLQTPEKQPAETKNKVTLYRWWTDGCPYCQASLPAIQQLRTKYEGEKDFQTVAIYHPKPPQRTADEDILKVIKETKYDGPVAVDRDWSELRTAYLSHSDRRATSVSILVDVEGKIRFVHPGPVFFPSDDPRYEQQNEDYEKLDKAIEVLLREAKQKKLDGNQTDQDL